MSEIQGMVLKFVEKYQLETDIDTRMLDLMSEVGELSKALLKGTCYGKTQFIATDKWTEEFGDVLFSLVCLANSTDINIENALEIAFNKYRSRFESKGSIGSEEA